MSGRTADADRRPSVNLYVGQHVGNRIDEHWTSRSLDDGGNSRGALRMSESAITAGRDPGQEPNEPLGPEIREARDRTTAVCSASTRSPRRDDRRLARGPIMGFAVSFPYRRDAPSIPTEFPTDTGTWSSPSERRRAGRARGLTSSGTLAPDTARVQRGSCPRRPFGSSPGAPVPVGHARRWRSTLRALARGDRRGSRGPGTSTVVHTARRRIVRPRAAARRRERADVFSALASTSRARVALAADAESAIDAWAGRWLDGRSSCAGAEGV